MTNTARPRLPMDDGARGLRRAIMLSAAVHVAILATLVLWKGGPGPARPPVYRVSMVAAPAGVRQAGVVAPPTNTPPEPTKAAAPKAAEKAAPPEKSTASKSKPAPAKATPSIAKSRDAGKNAPTKNSKAAPPAAGGGPTGGKGADVATVKAEGIDFPYSGYLTNIVRQITINFQVPPAGSTLRAEVRFMIHRDGSVSGIEIVKRSGSQAFDLDAMGAIEAVGARRGFGPLPTGFADDVLPVYFIFSPDMVL